MGQIQNLLILLLSVIIELSLIYRIISLYLQEQDSYQNATLVLLVSYTLMQLLRLIVKICKRLLIGWEAFYHIAQIFRLKMMLIISVVLLSEQILLLIQDQNLSTMTWINLLFSFIVIVYFNIQIYKILGLSRSGINLLDITLLILIIHEIIFAIIIQIFLLTQYESYYHYQNLILIILTLFLSYYTILQKNNLRKNYIKLIILLQYACCLYETVLLLNENSLVQQIHTFSALLNLYNIYFLYNNHSKFQRKDDKQSQKVQLKCNFCKKQIFDSIKINSLVAIYSYERIVYYTSCPHIFHSQCAPEDKQCCNKMCAQPYYNIFQQKYHYKISLIINCENYTGQKHKQKNKNLLLIIFVILQIIHIIFLPYIQFLYDQSINLIILSLIISNQITMVIVKWKVRDSDLKYCIQECLMFFFNGLVLVYSPIIKWYIIFANDQFYFRFFYFIFFDLNNFIFSLNAQILYNVALNNMSLIDLLYNQTDNILLPVNLLQSFIIILINSEPQILWINIFLLMFAVFVLGFIQYSDTCEQIDSSKECLLKYILTYLVNCCLVTFYIQIDQLYMGFQNDLFFIIFSICILIYSVKINIRSSQFNDALRYAEKLQINDLGKLIYRGFQLKNPLLCWKCGEIQQQGQLFTFFLFCQHTFHEECLPSKYYNLDNFRLLWHCTVCLQAQRFSNFIEQYMYLELN